MRFNFKCYECEIETPVDAQAFKPPRGIRCVQCGESMDRVYGCQIDTSGCKDHGFIPDGSRVVDSDMSYNKSLGVQKEQAFNAAIKRRRAQLTDGGNKGAFRHTHSVPAELFHGKVKETGDKDYWKDPKNVARHSNTRVDNGQ